MTPSELAELERLEKEATAGPWQECGCGKCGLVWSLPVDAVVGNRSGKPDPDADGPEPSAEQQSKNAALVSALRNAAPSLIATARRAQRAMEVLYMESVNIGGTGDSAWQAIGEALAILRGEKEMPDVHVAVSPEAVEEVLAEQEGRSDG